MKLASCWPSLPPAMRFFQVSPTPLRGPFIGLYPLFRTDDQDPPVLIVSLTDATIFASVQNLASRCRMPLLGISKDRPSVVSRSESPLPYVHFCPHFGGTEPPFTLVPSSRFHTTLTVYASSTLHVYCTVLPTLGFAVF